MIRLTVQGRNQMPDIREFDEMWADYATANFGFPQPGFLTAYFSDPHTKWLLFSVPGGNYKWKREVPLQCDGLGDPGADPAADWNKPETDPTNPDYYKFPNGAETIDITEWLSGCGAQAVQYIVRATRTDGKVKGDPVEDLTKTLWFVRREIDRLTAQS